MIRILSALVLIAPITLSLTGCGNSTAPVPAPTGNVCRISAIDENMDCRVGDLVIFLPPTFGNKQLPILAAAVMCDFRHTIVHNEGGVTCVFGGERSW